MFENNIELGIGFVDSKEKRPEHMQRCLCYDSYMPGYYCYVYDDISKYWCNQYTEEHDVNGDNHICDYADSRVTKWFPLNVLKEVSIKNNEGISSSDAVAGDICLFNKITKKLVIIPFVDFDIKKYNLRKYRPVGVVVIPGSHDVYGDGSCAVMSLKEMDYNTPDTGSTSYKNIYWGQNGTNISNITNYNQVYYVGSNGSVNKTIQGVTDYAYLPSDRFTTVQNPYDKDTYFYFNDSDKYIPSPYNEDDSRNSAYYQTTSPSSSNNAMSDFDGIGNTKILTDLVTKQTNWKTSNTITNEYSSGYSPAACCCWRYHTDGTKQGDWYLPAIGELGYMMVKLKKIQQTILTLISAYGSSVGVLVAGGSYYWSSSEYDSYTARYVNTLLGTVNYTYKGNRTYVRAFLRVKI